MFLLKVLFLFRPVRLKMNFNTNMVMLGKRSPFLAKYKVILKFLQAKTSDKIVRYFGDILAPLSRVTKSPESLTCIS